MAPLLGGLQPTVSGGVWHEKTDLCQAGGFALTPARPCLPPPLPGGNLGYFRCAQEAISKKPPPAPNTKANTTRIMGCPRSPTSQKAGYGGTKRVLLTLRDAVVANASTTTVQRAHVEGPFHLHVCHWVSQLLVHCPVLALLLWPTAQCVVDHFNHEGGHFHCGQAAFI